MDRRPPTLAPSRPGTRGGPERPDAGEDEGGSTRAFERQEALAALALELSSDRPFEELLQLITDRARHVIGAHMAVTSQTKDGNWSQVITALSVSERFAEYRQYAAVPDGSGIYRLVCEDNRPMRLTQSELEAHPAFRGFGRHAATHPPLNGWLAAPLVGRDGSNLGVIQVSHKRDGEFSARDEAILVQLAQMAAAVIEDRLLRSQLQERVDDLASSLGAVRRMHEERRRLLGQLVAAQEEERGRLARELHDDPVQIMTAVSMRLEIVRRHLTAEELPAFERLQLTVAEAITRLRRMMFELRPLALDDGLVSALNHYLHQHDLVDRGSVISHVLVEPPPGARTILYRVAQEALTRIRRRADASVFELVLSERDDGYLLEIREETGLFGDAAGGTRGDVGLASMRERAELADGWFVAGTTPGGGSNLRAWIPRDPAARVLPA